MHKYVKYTIKIYTFYTHIFNHRQHNDTTKIRLTKHLQVFIENILKICINMSQQPLIPSHFGLPPF